MYTIIKYHLEELPEPLPDVILIKVSVLQQELDVLLCQDDLGVVRLVTRKTQSVKDRKTS